MRKMYYCLSCGITYDGNAQCCPDLQHVPAEELIKCLTCKKVYNGDCPCCHRFNHVPLLQWATGNTPVPS